MIYSGNWTPLKFPSPEILEAPLNDKATHNQTEDHLPLHTLFYLLNGQAPGLGCGAFKCKVTLTASVPSARTSGLLIRGQGRGDFPIRTPLGL